MWGFTVIEWVKEGCDIIGVTLMCDNGDSQYLTIKEYINFTKVRDERSKEG